jgi:hypothetical protein
VATNISSLRAVALALPEATEEPHFDLTSWRVRGRIFATVPNEPGRLRVFLDEADVAEVIALDPAAYEELRWGQRLAGVTVDLRKAKKADVVELLQSAWRRKAPKRLVAGYDRDG